ncbi:LacI family DNA-binding transcriptional regulator [Mariniflexile litorale]|uniref:LacI family DNA-binding transcriptional regulator n=1 Tax=Mariniflexile litorale TaxID=3045158 RepID=A0AAU7EHH6_9FLAO|nr:LacI family DNA-binding transcriptional regulator [Mariniflexile sp. KMM 9835]MDQ8211926.1 LacI family DNA-binding transcriptional regulator [Mariniflexile sp. KMM 9835]
MKNKRHSIKDIAKSMGVSVTTVSFVLNGKAEEKKISKAVTKKILDYVEKIEYKPNQFAQGLRTGKSKIIVFMVEDFYFFFAKLATIIEDLAYKKGYKVIFCTNENKDNKSIELIDLYRNIKVDGYIIIPSPGLMPKIKELIDEGLPVILTDRYFPELDSNYVVIDNKEASYRATKHLITNNFKNIGFVTNDIEQTQMLDRLNGYKEAIEESNLSTHVITIPFDEYTLTRNKLEDNIKKFIEEMPQLDAIYFATNYLAISGLNVIKKNFPHYMDELGIMSFDDLDFFEFYTPTITAVSQPYFEIAQSLMDLMLNLLKDGKKNGGTTRIKLKTNLEIRNSTLSR